MTALICFMLRCYDVVVFLGRFGFLVVSLRSGRVVVVGVFVNLVVVVAVVVVVIGVVVVVVVVGKSP